MNPNSITERLANLSPAKRALLEQRLKGKSVDRRAVRAIPIRASREFAPLSFAQERMWFLNQLEPESPAYNEPRAVRLTGLLEVDALQESLNRIIARHEVLRTIIVPVDVNPVQRIVDRRTIELPQIDLRGQAVQKREAEAHRLINEAIRRPFDLSRDLMLRVLLLRLEDEQHILVLVTHHVASDGWSSAIFWQDLAALYQAIVFRGSPHLSELPVQYADYAAWQREWLRGEVLETQLSYWRKQLDNLATLQLQTDRARPAIQSFRGARQTLVLGDELSEGLKALSRREGVTLFMTLLAAFQALLYRYTGQEDIAIGSPIAGRNRVETEGLIGFFVNALVLRTGFSGHPTFRELLGRVRAVCVDAYSYQDLPFEKLVEELQPQRKLNHNPLFQVTFQLNSGPRPLLKLPGVDVEDMEFVSGISKFDLSVTLTDRGEQLAGWLQYNTDLFEAATITRMAGHFQSLLEGILADPDRRIADLPLLSEAEKHQVLVEWNQTKRNYPKGKCVHQLFEDQARRRPEAVAVVFEERQLSYGELNRRANQLAHYLRKLGVGPEVLAGICIDRSLEMIVGLLGIFKAGGAYVPLDPEYPKERLAFMLEDANVRVLLTQQRLLEDLSQHDARVVCLDREWDKISKESEENPNNETSGENLAYIIYTSGSTGRSKGVAVEQRQVLNYVFSILDRLELPYPNSFATVSTLGADLGNTVIFSSWCTGASLHVISRDRLSDGEAMAEYLSRHAIDCLKIAPSHLAALQTSSRRENVLPRKLLILGGEAAKLEWVKNLQRLAPRCAIMNHYGPTESTIGVATYRIERETLLTDFATVPLGRPLSNSQIYLLDQNLNPVPVGIAAELYIGGRSLTRGYLHRPDLTAEKFIPNPYSEEPGARLYKTGDRARYLPDGNIEFLGRTDRQVKIRGYRIEPGEIEAKLREHPDIRDGAVKVHENESGDKRLIAYVVARPDRAPTVGGKPRYRLPNGAAVAQLNKNETDYIYQEIFERQAYLRHGITIKDGDCIFDVGANIGLFTLFANQIVEGPKVYSFEPNPTVYEILRANATLYGSEVRLFNCGLANEAKRSTFTFFPGFSLLSGFYSDARAEKEVVKTFMANQQKAGIGEMAELVEQADALLEGRFDPQAFDAELRTLSSVLEQESIERIDLLKINVEKSELDVLLGIKESDWQKIRQIVLEVDVKNNLPAITSLLERHGYEYVVEQDNLLEGTSLCYVYAIRASGDGGLVREQQDGAHIRPVPVLANPLLSTSDLRSFLGNKLPEHMVPSVFMFLDALPLTPNGKVNRQALPAPAPVRPELDETSAPRTPVEELLANIWAEVLKLDKVGIHDNFFELGGHSLLATQVVSRVRHAFQIELPLRTLFDKRTICDLAKAITELRSESVIGEVFTHTLNEIESFSDEQTQRWVVKENVAGGNGNLD
jgi:amino acid adenylation domain-containing protein/FkbM family methyltransferase